MPGAASLIKGAAMSVIDLISLGSAHSNLIIANYFSSP